MNTIIKRPHLLKLVFSAHRRLSQFIDKEFLNLLVCPLSKEPLRYVPDTQELVCDKLGVAYPVKGGIPMLAPQDGHLINESSHPHDNHE